MTDIVRVTPLLGGKTDGAVCSLLEIGGSRILLDCGGIVDFDFNVLLGIANELVAGGGIDAVVIRSVSVSVIKNCYCYLPDNIHHYHSSCMHLYHIDTLAN